MKHDKFYALTVVLLAVSLLGAVIMKSFGFDVFVAEAVAPEWFTKKMQFGVEFFMMCAQFVLIIGCITWFPLRKICNYFLVIIMVNVIPYLVPSTYHILISSLLTMIMVIVLKPKIITVASFFVNVPIISAVQLILVFIKSNMMILENPFFDTTTLLLINIDQFILLVGLYYINRKVGEKIELVLLRRKG